ncbi:DUF4159 domain-containing protein [Ensifer sp. ENS03]|uniref:DUF4159 domain-containing protein n=1 Tax=Ensifer sp. ENS03 TaxID=2769283 RepID=UPI0017875C36|nr:DUF4159 domain-containing protein [Ensifer sp. ENS03]MBD9557033.1 DUF4159 domain-containing protein [Ensifer sp. ENS03]
MSGLAFLFTNPAILAALVALPVIWWLLRMTPPRPSAEVFPPLRILASVMKREETPAQSPWWLTLLRMLMAAALILAIADPVINPRQNTLSSAGPLALVIDNSWATVSDWNQRVEAAAALIDDAEAKELPVSIVFTTDRQHDATPASAAAARDRLAAAQPQPLPADRERALAAMKAALAGSPPGTLAFLSDGIEASNGGTMQQIAELGATNVRRVEGNAESAIALTAATNETDGMRVTASRLPLGEPRAYYVLARDIRGTAIAEGELRFATGATTADALLKAPFELRNDFARLTIEGQATAGGLHLLDDGNRRRRVALLSGEVHQSQPLLSPLYYIKRALEPHADLIEPREEAVGKAIAELLAQNPSILVMADVGRLPDESYPLVTRWLENGGMLVRFAGPRLAGAPADDPLVPVVLRQGERTLDGALSWSEPQPLADYPSSSPFAGLERPRDVLVKRQVLAQPTPDLTERTWANLADGTPLVTTAERGRGRIVLFHVSADPNWSNLPISGSFVDMLRRSIQLSRAGGVAGDQPSKAQTLPPYRLVSARGELTGDTGSARPLEIAPGIAPTVSADTPPGLYGSEEGFVANNLLPDGGKLTPITGNLVGARAEGLEGARPFSIRPYLFGLALALFVLDTLIVLYMAGGLAGLRRRAGRGAAAAALVATLGLATLGLVAALAPAIAHAQDSQPSDEQTLQRLDTTHLAYVITGEQEVDRLSEQGLIGLSNYLTYRTALEPGAPVGVDLEQDELAFYPIIYWPVSATAPMPSSRVMSRIDAYMRNGGTVLFDTRDQFSSLTPSDAGDSPNVQRLQAMLSGLDIPPLEPVPSDHVLTKAFYLLSNFPGRYAESQLWVEAAPNDDEDRSNRPVRGGDGVTPIMITGNDFAGAWAVDVNGAPLLPTVPPDEMQREYAYRAGVNIMMYMLTGNYKADQVHVPDLLQRLGQ